MTDSNNDVVTVLKEELEELYDETLKDYHYKYVADKILSLPSLDMNGPSGMVVKTPCKKSEPCRFGVKFRDCPHCHGTGFITRPLTNREAIELLKEYVKMLPLPDDERIIYIALPDGSRVELEKEVKE